MHNYEHSEIRFMLYCPISDYRGGIQPFVYENLQFVHVLLLLRAFALYLSLIHISMLEGMFRKRLKQYQKEGYFLQEQNQIVEVSQLMYEGQSYKHVFLDDIKASSSEILIMNAHYELGKIKSYFDVMQEKAHQNVQLYVVLNDDQRQKEMLVRTIEGMGAARCV